MKGNEKQTTIEDLAALLGSAQAIKRIEERLMSIEKMLCAPQPEKPINDTMLLEDALEFLKDNGRPTSRSTLYKETCMGSIPSKRVGKRRVFSRRELKAWLEAGMPKQIEMDAADRLAERIGKYGKV